MLVEAVNWCKWFRTSNRFSDRKASFVLLLLPTLLAKPGRMTIGKRFRIKPVTWKTPLQAVFVAVNDAPRNPDSCRNSLSNPLNPLPTSTGSTVTRIFIYIVGVTSSDFNVVIDTLKQLVWLKQMQNMIRKGMVASCDNVHFAFVKGFFFTSKR